VSPVNLSSKIIKNWAPIIFPEHTFFVQDTATLAAFGFSDFSELAVKIFYEIIGIN